jgi:anhydro-N-acetylmuramic acid kinase
MRAIGLMSGTSLDGIDVADVDVQRVDGRIAVRLLHFTTTPFGRELRACLMDSLPPHDANTACIGELNVALGEAFASAVLQAARDWQLDLRRVDVIGSHGHTLYHAPSDGVTMQIGEAAIIAARSGVTCVADFRVADVAQGGQGAPLVPFVDRELFSSDGEYRVAVNIGGIANLTLLPPGRADSVRAFDCGPGNMVIDECMRLASDGATQRDEGGATAARGSVAAALLDELMTDPFFALAPPKSTGRERFGAAYSRAAWERGASLGLSAETIVATVTALTARAIAGSIPVQCRRAIVSGGGAHNRTLLDMLRSELERSGVPTSVELSDAHGVPVDAKEAVAFAVLACEAVAGRINQLPRCTGARGEAVLGKVVPGSNFAELMRGIWSGGAPGTAD